MCRWQRRKCYKTIPNQFRKYFNKKKKILSRNWKCPGAFMTDAVRSAWSPESPPSPTWGDAGTVGAWRAGYPDQESRGNIRPCVFLHNKCPSTRQSHLERAIRLSSARAERLRLYQRGHDESSTDSLSDGPWVSMHLNEAFLPRLRTTQGFLNSLSLVKHYIKHNNNSHPAPHPPPHSTSFFK